MRVGNVFPVGNYIYVGGGGAALVADKHAVCADLIEIRFHITVDFIHHIHILGDENLAVSAAFVADSEFDFGRGIGQSHASIFGINVRYFPRQRDLDDLRFGAVCVVDFINRVLLAVFVCVLDFDFRDAYTGITFVAFFAFLSVLAGHAVFTGSAVFAVFACGTGIAFFTLLPFFALRALRARCAGIALVTLIAFVALFAFVSFFAFDRREPCFVCSGRIAVRFGVGGVERVCLTEGVVGSFGFVFIAADKRRCCGGAAAETEQETYKFL